MKNQSPSVAPLRKNTYHVRDGGDLYEFFIGDDGVVKSVKRFNTDATRHPVEMHFDDVPVKVLADFSNQLNS